MLNFKSGGEDNDGVGVAIRSPKMGVGLSCSYPAYQSADPLNVFT
jgi:hypothetical protein